MPVPATATHLFDQLRRSGLIPAARLDEVAHTTDPTETPAATLVRLTELGLLTPFQADRIAVGKYKGFILGGYVILDKIGGGGMGQVYLAEHTAMRRRVALKVLAVTSAADPVARERFYREARAAATLDHPNIIKVFDLRQDGHVLFLVMEFLEGVTLQHAVGRGGPLSPHAAAHYAWQIAHGLQHAHEHGLVHRDVKPANILLTRDGTAKVLDLGLVRSPDADESKLTAKVDKAILGTADYLAPEQAVNSSTVDIRADIYGLGATMYYLLAGRPMFPDGRTAQKLMWQQLKEPTPIGELRPDVPPELADVLHRALRKKPADRFDTPADFAAALEPFAAGPAPQPAEELLPAPAPRWLAARPGSIPMRDIPADDTASEVAIQTPNGDRDPALSASRSSHLIDIRSQIAAHSATLADRRSATPLLLPPEARESWPAAAAAPPRAFLTTPLGLLTVIAAAAIAGGVGVWLAVATK